MKQLKYLFISLAALCMAACTQDDDFLPDGGTDTADGDLQEYTFTVGIDRSMEGDDESVSTRATATTDDAPTRCLMQAIYNGTGGEVYTGEENGNGYSFTVKLAAGNTYTFCFWADNGTQDVTSLTAVPYTIGTIAFAESVTDTPENLVTNGITLAHVVTKVSLVTTAATTIAEDEPFTAATQCAGTYNVLTGTASGTQDYTTSETSGSFSANAGVTSFYVLPAADTQDITIGCHLLEQAIASVPLAVNTHVTLRGDLSEESGNWQTTDEYIVAQMNEYFFGENGTPIGQSIIPDEYLLDGTAEDVNKLFQKITRNPDFLVGSGERQWIIGSGYGDKHYLFLIYSEVGGGYVTISWRRDSEYIDWITRQDSSLPKFPTVDP